MDTASLSPEKDQSFLPQKLEKKGRDCRQLHLLAQIITANPEKQRVVTGLFSKSVHLAALGRNCARKAQMHKTHFT